MRPTIEKAIGPFIPQRQIMGTGDFYVAMRQWARSDPSHGGLAGVFFALASAVETNGSLGDKCNRSIVDQLREMGAEVDQDYINQQDEKS